jgi:hydroxyacylglutathione hydrolase
VAIVANIREQVDEAFTRLARVGIESVKGYILIDNFSGEKKIVEQVCVEEVSNLTETEKFIQFVDVRRAAEYADGHAYRARNIPLSNLANEVDRLFPDSPTYVICQSGYRSSIAAGILENAGFKAVYNVTGGTAAWLNAGLPVNTPAYIRKPA